MILAVNEFMKTKIYKHQICSVSPCVPQRRDRQPGVPSDEQDVLLEDSNTREKARILPYPVLM